MCSTMILEELYQTDEVYGRFPGIKYTGGNFKNNTEQSVIGVNILCDFSNNVLPKLVSINVFYFSDNEII